MKLITSLTSPFGRKARIVLLEKRIECPIEEDIPWESQTRVPEFNPLGKVPVLVLDDGQTLFDSRVIVEHLDNISPVTRLIPGDSREAITCKRWEALADGIGDAAAAIFIERKRPQAQQSSEWLARQEEKINRGLNAMSTELADRAWCTGNGFTLADIAVGCCLGYLKLRFPANHWDQAYPNLAQFYLKIMQRPSFSETQPPVN